MPTKMPSTVARRMVGSSARKSFSVGKNLPVICIASWICLETDSSRSLWAASFFCANRRSKCTFSACISTWEIEKNPIMAGTSWMPL